MAELNVTVTKKAVFPGWLFIPVYPFETPKQISGWPPFTIPDYIATPQLMRKALIQSAIAAAFIWMGKR